MTYRLYIGNRTFSSWSLRGWLIMQYAKVDFKTITLYLDEDQGLKTMHEQSPTSQVPFLEVTEDTQINHPALWIGDTIAIGEYMAEVNSDLWPKSVEQRASARMICAFVHSGVQQLRQQCPMNLSRIVTDFNQSEVVSNELFMLERLMQPALSDFQKNNFKHGLYGHFTNVDAFLTPIAIRVVGYSLKIGDSFAHYLDSLLQQSYLQQWAKDAKLEQTDVNRLAKSNQRYGQGMTVIGDYKMILA